MEDVGSDFHASVAAIRKVAASVRESRRKPPLNPVVFAGLLLIQEVSEYLFFMSDGEDAASLPLDQRRRELAGLAGIKSVTAYLDTPDGERTTRSLASIMGPRFAAARMALGGLLIPNPGDLRAHVVMVIKQAKPVDPGGRAVRAGIRAIQVVLGSVTPPSTDAVAKALGSRKKKGHGEHLQALLQEFDLRAASVSALNQVIADVAKRLSP